MKIISKNLGIYDPHEIVLSMFETGDVPFLASNTNKEFKYKSIVFIFLLLLLRAAFGELVPSILDVFLVGVVLYAFVSVFIDFIRFFNNSTKSAGVFGIIDSALLLFLSIIVVGLF